MARKPSMKVVAVSLTADEKKRFSRCKERCNMNNDDFFRRVMQVYEEVENGEFATRVIREYKEQFAKTLAKQNPAMAGEQE